LISLIFRCVYFESIGIFIVALKLAKGAVHLEKEISHLVEVSLRKVIKAVWQTELETIPRYRFTDANKKVVGTFYQLKA
jgi:hypothetical protein